MERGSPMVGRDEEDITMLLAGLVYNSDCGIRRLNALDGGLIHARMTNHVRGRKVVHQELILAVCDPLSKFLGNRACAHFRVQVISGHLGRRNHLPVFSRELLLNTAIEEESDVRVLLGLGNMALLDVLFGEPFGKDVIHELRRESNGECVVRLVLCHCREVDVLGIREIWLGGSVEVSQKLGDLSHAI